MAYVRTTKDEFHLHVDYGGGWEHEVTEETRVDVIAQVKTYRENCPQYPVKWTRNRVPIENNA